MAHYFFDTKINGSWARDEEGLVLPDLDAARCEAVGALYGLVNELEPKVAEKQILLCVRDSAQHIVFRTALSLSVTDS